MSKIALTPNASGTGTLTVAAPNTNTDRTLTLPDATTTLVGTDATQTLTNKSIASSQLTGALPAIDGSALTGISSLTLLGTLATTSGTSVTLSGLTLTSYKQLQYVANGLSTSVADSAVRLNGKDILTPSQSLAANIGYGGGIIDLLTGVFFGASSSPTAGGTQANASPSGLTTSSTSITFTVSLGTFDAGTITIYGVK